MSNKLYVCLSLDVEEEGLFSGSYRTKGVSVENVPLIRGLLPLSRRYKLPLTLFCAWSVFNDPAALASVLGMRDGAGAEIGGHLHHWSTPPFGVEQTGPPIRTDKLAPDLLSERLHNLLYAGEKACGKPLTSFRMGRWDLKKPLLPELARAGIKVDSSICPLRKFRGGPDHFLAPAIPYWVNTEAGRILEAPLTQIPLSPMLARLWARLWPNSPRILDSFHFFGALSANPVWHSALVMRLATRLHYRRGGRLLNLFLHSSELMPGASPNVPDQKAANLLLAKLEGFCEWLHDRYELVGVTASQIAELPFADQFSTENMDTGSDW